MNVTRVPGDSAPNLSTIPQQRRTASSQQEALKRLPAVAAAIAAKRKPESMDTLSYKNHTHSKFQQTNRTGSGKTTINLSSI